jgi:retron-type reverse transcriptase
VPAVPDQPARPAFHIADVLLPISIILWAVGTSRTNANNLGGLGLVTALSPIFYAGVVLLAISALIELNRPQPTRWRMAAHAAGLVVMLYATPAIVYPQGRYAWLYKTIGVVQLINHQGHLTQHLDIYNNWPGFFALAAQFGKVAGISTPLAYAKWAQVVFELAALPLLYLCYSALSLPVWQRWMALLLYSASNWIGQDYYSPQGLGTVLSLGIMAMILRWLYGGNRDPLARRRRFFRKKSAAVPQAATQPDRSPTVSRVEVYEAYRTMRGYQGPPGIDGMTVRDFEEHLPRNLQRVWTQLRDGTYTPSPLRVVPPPSGRGRPLAVLTVSDMIAQIVVARELQAEFSRRREKDRERLSQRAPVAPGRWNVEVDAHSVFTTCRHDLLLRVVEAATDEEWLAGYVARFLRTSERLSDASGTPRLGTMPGSPLSTVLADLFLYYSLDRWAMDHFPEVKLFRELDTAVVHCESEHQARSVRAAIWQRLDDVSLQVAKTDVQVERATRGEQTEVFAMPTAQMAQNVAPVEAAPADRATGRAAKARARLSGRDWVICGVLMVLFFVLSFTHELSPYIVIVQILVLAAGRLLRPRWLPIAFGLVAVGFLLPRLGYVNRTYGLLDSIGNFFSNVAPPSAVTDEPVVLPSSQIFDQRAAEALSLLMWLLSVIGAWRRRRSGRTVLTLFALTFSPALVLAGGAYGNEGVLRVYLFSLPWAAALAAAALEPARATLSRAAAQLRGAGAGAGNYLRSRLALGWIRAGVGFGLVLALFFVAFFGDDASNVMTESEVMVTYHWLQTAKVGPIYCAGDNAPTEDTYRYADFQLPTIFGTQNATPLVKKATPNLAAIVAKDSLSYTNNKQPAYVLITPSMIQYSVAYGEAPASSYTILIDSLNKSPKWKLLIHQDGTYIYELPPGQG